MKYILILLTIFSSIANATNYSPSLGLEGGDHQSFIIGDYNLFDQTEMHMGVKRMGGGFSRLEIGNGIGLNMSANTSIFLTDELLDFPVEPRVAWTIMGGRIGYNTNNSLMSYYLWNPVLEFGPQAKMGNCRAIVVGRYGPTIGNFSTDNLSPQFNMGIGAGGHFTCEDIKLSVTNLNFNNNQIVDGDLQYGVIALRYEKLVGDKEENNYMFLFRWSEF